MFIFSKYDQIHNSEYFPSMIIFKTIRYTQPYITFNISIQCISPHSMSTQVTLSLPFDWVTADAMREGKCLAKGRSRFSEGDRPIEIRTWLPYFLIISRISSSWYAAKWRSTFFFSLYKSWCHFSFCLKFFSFIVEKKNLGGQFVDILWSHKTFELAIALTLNVPLVSIIWKANKYLKHFYRKTWKND
jgi:hypothetical protein